MPVHCHTRLLLGRRPGAEPIEDAAAGRRSTVVGASSASDAQAANINAAQAMGKTFDIMV